MTFSEFAFFTMEKPARVQVEPDSLPDDKPPQTGNTFNVWYLRWSGGDGSKQFTKLKFRVNIKKDSGYTKANKTSTTTVCIYFSKGCCYKGHKCEYLHRLPTEDDYIPPTKDCFGRDKTMSHRDDMNGVGLLNTFNDTLYITGLHMSSNMESVITKHFGEFGKIVKIKLLPSRNCGFLTYKNEFEALFAKEAMQSQSLDDNEVLVVRWANEDPDPAAQASKKRKLEESAMKTIQKLLDEAEDLNVENGVDDLKTTEPEVQEPESPTETTSKDTKLLESSFFNANSLLVLSKLKKKKPNPQPVPIVTALSAMSAMLGYSSDDD